jgi:(1->4)-alpha-D-glucan 1-alpha-D-glucosylmutase
MSAAAPWRRPVSSYRLQLQGGLGFTGACDLVPYLSELGVTECYTSPYLQARAGSAHGYDICDHSRKDASLGSDGDHRAFADALKAHGMGHIMDVVPNHMAADPEANPWWRDVLENGPSSPYATYFDIEWSPIKPELVGKVLLPVLGDQYGRALERGELRLRFADGALHLEYFDRTFPISPRQAPRIFGIGLDALEASLGDDADLREFQSILTSLQNLPPHAERDPARIVERQREKLVARERLLRLADRSAAIRAHIEDATRIANGTPDDPASFDRLHDLLEHQPYRLAYWRTAVHEINYRRFFDINELVAIRMEEPAVFDAAHVVVSDLIARDIVTGVRVDHPDGLFDPGAYLERLQALAASAVDGTAGDPRAGHPLYVVVEKILADGETLPQSWPVAGTTGYGFLNLVAGLFIDARHAARLRRIYARTTGQSETFAEVAYRSKLTILGTSMASELNVLAHDLNRISERNRRWRDFTVESCREALREVIACFPAYRTYLTDSGPDAVDRQRIESAVAEARRRNPLVEASVFTFVEDILLASGTEESADPDAQERLRFAMQFQQFTGPVEAKGVEDTAFYRYNVLVCTNDVGGLPNRLGVSPETFHEANRKRLEQNPLELIATSTHDTKRGEDTRVRQTVISEMPDAWRRGVSDWMRMNSTHRTRIDAGWAPDRNDEYLFYQALLGVWPAEAADAPIPQKAPDDLVARLGSYMLKAVREAKVHTSWLDENQPYSQAVARFVEKVLSGRGAAKFLASFVPFQRLVARLGATNALAQLVLKIASPGVPDFYQGSELWDLTLVDPDNRRPVDFSARRQMLEELRPLVASIEAGADSSGSVKDLFGSWHDGRIKMLVTACGLRLRKAMPDVLLDGGYLPMEPHGMAAERLVAFVRQGSSGVVVAAVPRLSSALVNDRGSWPVGEAAWGDTTLSLPVGIEDRRYRHALTGEILGAREGEGRLVLDARDVFRHCPVALLVG